MSSFIISFTYLLLPLSRLTSQFCFDPFYGSMIVCFTFFDVTEWQETNIKADIVWL